MEGNIVAENGRGSVDQQQDTGVQGAPYDRRKWWNRIMRV